MSGLEYYERSTFHHDAKTRDVYRRGVGPAVIVMAEMPGITPKVIEFADRVVELGCTSVLPHLFGVPGAPLNAVNAMRSLGPACISNEFAVLAKGETSPAVSWCRALAADAHRRCGGPGVGVVGMCFTGNFALGMAADPSVIAPVLSQPSLPFAITPSQQRDVHASPRDLDAVVARFDQDPDLCVLGLRFTHDRTCPPQRFESLRRLLGDRFVAVEIDSSPGNPHGNSRLAHSVLTEHLVDEPGHPTRDALDQVLDLFRRRLLTPE